MDNVPSPISDSSKDVVEEDMQTEDQDDLKDLQMKRKRSPTLQENENGNNSNDHRAQKKRKKRRKWN